MVWEEVDNDYRVGTIRGGNGRGDTHTHAHTGGECWARTVEKRSGEKWMGRIRREENRMAREAE